MSGEQFECAMEGRNIPVDEDEPDTSADEKETASDSSANTAAASDEE